MSIDIKTINKKANMTLVGVDGNAYSLMAAWQRQAKRDGFTSDEIKSVLAEATSGDYEHLVGTLDSFCEEEEEEEDPCISLDKAIQAGIDSEDDYDDEEEEDE